MGSGYGVIVKYSIPSGVWHGMAGGAGRIGTDWDEGGQAQWVWKVEGGSLAGLGVLLEEG
jgi:hypothetical protein